MKKILIVDLNYPSQNNLGDPFVHVRAKYYKKDYDVRIVSCNNESSSQYIYDGVNVLNFKNKNELSSYVIESNQDVLLIHFFDSWMTSLIYKLDIPIIIWVHSFEAQNWYRRLMSLEFSFLSLKILLSKLVICNFRMLVWNRLIRYSNKTAKVRFVFVSEWIKRVLETDCLRRCLNYNIIPNPIDSNLFQYIKKNSEQRKKILVLKSFGSKLYSGDRIVKTILELSKRPFFKELKFYIRGWGNLFRSLTEPLRKFDNIEFHEGFVNQKLIPEIHKDFGILLCPTRQDSQGVSMCEAMSSGLVPIAWQSTAIPEFVEDGVSGFLPRSCREAADSIELLYKHPERFLEMSYAASETIRSLSSTENVIDSEIRLIENVKNDVVHEEDIKKKT